MSVSLVLDLVHRVTSEDPKTRDAAADEVADIVRSIDIADADLLARVLVAMRLVEDVETCQEAQLHALVELLAWHELSRMNLGRLRYLDPTSIVGSQVEYLETLLAEAE